VGWVSVKVGSYQLVKLRWIPQIDTFAARDLQQEVLPQVKVQRGDGGAHTEVHVRPAATSG
jgi:hypothetical protein